jgi:hypothetical protein
MFPPRKALPSRPEAGEITTAGLAAKRLRTEIQLKAGSEGNDVVFEIPATEVGSQAAGAVRVSKQAFAPNRYLKTAFTLRATNGITAKQSTKVLADALS